MAKTASIFSILSTIVESENISLSLKLKICKLTFTLREQISRWIIVLLQKQNEKYEILDATSANLANLASFIVELLTKWHSPLRHRKKSAFVF